jgi:hypothetical protein
MKFPTSSFELLDEIQKLVPERLPEAGETMESYNRYAGKRELVLQLIHARDVARRAATRADTPRKPNVSR